MDSESYRRSENVEPPSALDPYWALLFNPLRSQWLDPQGFNEGKRGLATARIAADFPTFPPVAPTPMSAQLGSEQLPKAPSPADVLTVYYGSEGFPAYPDPQAGGLRPADVLAAIKPSLREQSVPLAHPAGGAFGTLSPQEEAVVPATTARAVSNAPATIGDVLVGTAQSLGEDIKRMYQASARQEFDPAATFRTELNIAGMGMPFAARGGAGIFGGRLGAERLAAAGKPEALENLAKAEAMLAAGATRDAIHSATGWHQNQIGQWQFEIPDVGAGFRPQAPLPSERGIDKYVPGVGYKPTYGGQEMFAEHAFAHPDLYAAYPELRQLLMKFEDPLPETNWLTVGGLDPINRELYLNPAAFEENLAKQMGRKPGVAGMRSTTLHELQHAVQQAEGFPSGGGPGFPEVQRAADTEIKQNVKQWEEQLAAVHAKRDEWIAQKKVDEPTASTQDLAADYFRANPEAVRESADLHSKIYNANRGIGRQALLQKHYKRLAGEVEARNVQYRADLPEETLRTVPPWETQETPYGEQLIRMGDPALGMQAELPSFPDRMAAGKTAEFERAQRGQATGNYGLPVGGYKTPAAPKGSFEDLAARTRAGFKSDKERIIDEYRTATGQPAKGDVAPLLAPGETAEDVGLYLQAERPPQAYDFLTGRRPDAPFPEYADVYPPTGPPTMTPRGAGKQGTYPAKTLTPEAEAVAKAREKIIEDMRREGYQPFFDPSQRFPAEFGKQQGPHVDTAAAVAKKQETIERHLQTIGAPETLARLREGYSRGLDLPDAQAWYLMGQVERKMIESMGEEAGRKHFRDSLATAMATTTTGMSPPQNLIMAQYLNYLRATGQPFPTEAWQTPVAVGGQRTMPNVEAYAKAFSDPRGPYESLGLQNPKRVDFAQAQMGNPNAFTVDEQMAHGMLGVDVPTVGTYGLVTKVGREEAQRAGVEPQRYQDVAWGGFKKMLEDQARAKKGLPPLGPGAGYQGAPEISHVNDMIERIHRLTGRPRQEVWHKVFIEHSIPVYGLGGLTLGDVLYGQMQPAAPQ
jgi:Large polyvalent protein associated domain 23